jgi:hypothetical protein
MNELEPGCRKAGARWRTPTSLKSQLCATAPLAPPPYRGGQVVVAHGPRFLEGDIGFMAVGAPQPPCATRGCGMSENSTPMAEVPCTTTMTSTGVQKEGRHACAEIAVNSSLAMVEPARPKNEVEGALVLKIAFPHAAATAVQARLGGGSGSEPGVAALRLAAARLPWVYAYLPGAAAARQGVRPRP